MFNINDLFRYDLGIDPGSYKSRASVAGNSDIYDDFTYLTFNPKESGKKGGETFVKSFTAGSLAKLQDEQSKLQKAFG